MSWLSRRLSPPLIGILLAGAFLQGQSSSVTYVYDEIGRLVGVIDPAGDAATYTYDAVGNLLSIARHSAGTVSIVDFTPNSGQVGISVTIHGIGFSATPSSNTVTFNGVSATVVTATTIKLTVTVPAGATTGVIAVTSPLGSATSAASFSVTSNSAPTISSFTPAIAVIGTSLSITGTNFDTTLANDRLKVNLTPVYALSGTSTSLSTTVPASTASGRITVSTPLGTAVSSSDLFIPPSPFTAADVQYTSRMAYGESRGVAITTSGKIGLVVFDGALNQRTSIKAVSGPNSTVTVYTPAGGNLTQRSKGIFAVLLEPGYLPVAGTYTILVDPVSTGTGTLTLTLYNVPEDITGTLVPTNAGDSETFTTTTPGQNGRHTFSGTSGQRISMRVGGGPDGSVLIPKPDNSTLTSRAIGIFAGFQEPVTLGSTGTYTVFTNYLEEDTGTITNVLYDVPPNTTGTVTVNGGAVAVPLPGAGQKGSLTFSGTSGQLITVRMTGNTFGQVDIKLLKPDLTQLAIKTASASSFNMNQQTLPSTGTYTVVVDPYQWNKGTINVAVTDP